MAYDEVLSDRIRDLIIGTADITEQKMFGGLVFLVNGHMAVAASGQGGLLARVDPEESDDLVPSPATPPATPTSPGVTPETNHGAQSRP